jgi:hypothetical protein
MDISTFSPLVQKLLSQERTAELGPDRPNQELRPALQDLTAEKLFHPAVIRNHDFAQCCLSALWLYHGFLDESHTLSQEIQTAEGSYWHGIMHRREPDYKNAAYWFRRVGRHGIFDPLDNAAQELETQIRSGTTIPVPWDPFWFIDFCEGSSGKKGPDEELARRIQKCEWELLFEYCYRNALA